MLFSCSPSLSSVQAVSDLLRSSDNANCARSLTSCTEDSGDEHGEMHKRIGAEGRKAQQRQTAGTFTHFPPFADDDTTDSTKITPFTPSITVGNCTAWSSVGPFARRLRMA